MQRIQLVPCARKKKLEMSFINYLSVYTLMKAETNLPDRIYDISDIMCMQNLFEGRKRDLEKLAQLK